MRVISGIAKGHKLKTLEGTDTRPTTDRVKESLFSILNFSIYQSRALDLFAGSGSLGIEALSRGAAFCTFVEQSRQALTVVTDNLSHTKLTEKSQVIHGDALSFLTTAPDPYDLIFLDPPYHKNLAVNSLEMISRLHLLSDNGIISVECDQNESLPEQFGRLKRYQSRQYGRISLNFYKNTID